MKEHMNGRVAELQSDRAEAAEERRPDSHDPHPDSVPPITRPRSTARRNAQ